MLNPIVVQNAEFNYKDLSAFRNVHHKGSKNFDLQSCVAHQKKI